MSREDATNFGYAVAGVDNREYSQETNAMYAAWHAMAGVENGDVITTTAAKQQFVDAMQTAIINRDWALATHMGQDLPTESHAFLPYPQKLPLWPSSLDFWSKSLPHGYYDFFPSGSVVGMAEANTISILNLQQIETRTNSAIGLLSLQFGGDVVSVPIGYCAPAAGGFVIYPNKVNLNSIMSVYSK